ncbi:putative Impact [Operophtera brumata]|uniref:Putative Impact n=1 Tax=Operophtera brumata TaxID=104452 RepID=A0A0L7LGP9_OPEBR|nr:putative Impact [Operophtera brumata]
MEHDNLAKQAEEVEALTSIYGDDWQIESEASRSYRITIEQGKNEVLLYVTMPEDYPALAPPKYEISAPWMDRKAKGQLHAALDEVYFAMLAKLKQNKKILNATHNMFAYRIERRTQKGTSVVQDCDDDGETHAGGRMLHLLQILDQKNARLCI